MLDQKSSNSRYDGIQALRALAALLVVMFHAFKMVREKLGGPEIFFAAGAAGVDIFFAISGFVMVITTARFWGMPHQGGPFLRRRMVRIVPLYWLANTIMVLLLLYAPYMATYSKLVPWHTIASFLFIPAWNWQHETFPLVVAGWTLVYEMLFYLLFAAMLTLRLKPVPWLTGILILLGGLGIFRDDSWGAIATLLDPILIEFVLGMWIGVATLSGKRLPENLAIIAALVAMMLLLVSSVLPQDTAFKYRAIVWGLPSALLVFCVVSLENRFGAALSGWPRKLGDASYAIYLFHGFTISLVAFLLLFIPLDPTLTIMLGYAGCLIGASVAGLIIHQLIEQPIMQWARRPGNG